MWAKPSVVGAGLRVDGLVGSLEGGRLRGVKYCVPFARKRTWKKRNENPCGKQSLSTGVGLKNRGGRGGGKASLRLMWQVCERTGLQGIPKASWNLEEGNPV